MARNVARTVRIFFVRALESKSFVFTQTNRLNFRFKLLLRDIRHVYFATYLQVRNPQLPRFIVLYLGEEVNLKIIFFTFVQDTIGGAHCAATRAPGRRLGRAPPTAPDGPRDAPRLTTFCCIGAMLHVISIRSHVTIRECRQKQSTSKA